MSDEKAPPRMTPLMHYAYMSWQLGALPLFSLYVVVKNEINR